MGCVMNGGRISKPMAVSPLTNGRTRAAISSSRDSRWRYDREMPWSNRNRLKECQWCHGYEGEEGVNHLEIAQLLLYSFKSCMLSFSNLLLKADKVAIIAWILSSFVTSSRWGLTKNLLAASWKFNASNSLENAWGVGEFSSTGKELSDWVNSGKPRPLAIEKQFPFSSATYLVHEYISRILLLLDPGGTKWCKPIRYQNA